VKIDATILTKPTLKTEIERRRQREGSRLQVRARLKGDKRVGRGGENQRQQRGERRFKRPVVCQQQKPV
jgi:hypothetical protein